MMGPPDPYFCIHCGQSAPQVYKTYANGNLIKLLPCKRCGQLIDNYVEYDQIIVVINLVLQNPIAYRHTLLNSAFLGFWKLGIVFMFVEAYCHWCFQKGVEYEASTTDFYELEINFYQVLFRTFFRSALFHSLVLLSCAVTGGIRRLKYPTEKPHPLQFAYLTIWKGLCLSGFSEIFKLIALIWSYSHDQSRMVMVDCLFVLSNTQSYFVTSGLSQIKSFLVILTCYLITKFIVGVYDEYICI